MKKVLILAYDFPPYNSIGGQRPWSWHLYFKERELEPIVITRHWDVEIARPEDCYRASKNQTVEYTEDENGKVIRVPFNPNLRDRLINKSGIFATIARKILSLATLIFEHSIPLFDNKKNIFREANKLLKSESVDCIIATGEPFVLFSHTDKLSRKFGIPWIADYRDGWSTNYNASSSVGKWLNEFWLKRIEQRVVSSASLITTAAPAFAKEIAGLIKKKEVEVQVVYNGYFEELHDSVRSNPLKPKFTIAHAGTIYPFQKLETLIEGVAAFKKKLPEAEFDLIFYGLKFQPEQIERIEEQSAQLPILFTERMPHDKMLDELRNCHVQLLLATPEKQQIYAKVFDYLGTGRPILMVENDQGPLAEILEGKENATICSTAEQICDYLERVYNNPSELSSIVHQDDTFTRRNQTKRLADLTHQVIKSKKE